MLDNRRRAFAEKLPAVRATRGPAEITALQARRDALAAELVRAEENADALVFAQPRERELLQRVEQGRVTLAAAAGDPDVADAAERLRRTSGALTWQLTQELPARTWDARKALRGTDAGLAEARTRDAALAQAQLDEPARHERFAARINALSQRLAGLLPQVAALSGEQQKDLQDIAVAELEQQQDRLAVYAAQARLAIAQIHDRAQFARRDETTKPAAGTGAPQ
jgi:hypothetical protein